ncbi:MAG: VTT domain-containing protein [Gemmatimonadota bacterium]|nr:VTT domain-containing protein [Gemmatimonadota bacterium]
MTSLEQPAATGTRRPSRERVSSGAVRALARLHRLAEAGWAATAVGVWGFLQASIVPGPVDGVLIPLGLADPKRAWRFAWSALAGCTLGALAAYAIGTLAFDTVGQTLLGWMGVAGPEVEHFRARFNDHGLWLVLLSTVTPLSGKIVAIAAGAFGVPLLPFVATIVVGRGIRYGTVAAVVRYFGDRVERYIERRYGKTLDELALDGRVARDGRETT